MTEETIPILGLTDEVVESLLKRAFRNTLILGLLPALALLFATGWRNAAMLTTGTLISAASIYEWLRLVRLINARTKNNRTQRGAIAATFVVLFFLLRLLFFGAAIYGSLKYIQGSPVALLCGLFLAVATLTWEGLRLLKQ